MFLKVGSVDRYAGEGRSHPNYIVVYQVGSDVIDILRILRSRQQYLWLTICGSK
jgi:hypothetical protein